MDRRDFIVSSAAVLAGSAIPSLFGATTATSGGSGPWPAGTPDFFKRFPACTAFEAKVPVIRLASGRIIHRFFDTSPISPSGRYVGLFRLPNENQKPQPGQAGDVVLVDLQTGKEQTLAQTRGWETQMGANVQWGKTDADLFFNDVDTSTWTPFAVHFTPQTGAARRLSGTVFTVSPDCTQLASYNLASSRLIQVGYGVVVPEDRTPRNKGPVDNDGLFITDIATGKSRMIASIRDIYERAVPDLHIENAERYEYYCFQIRWNPQGTRVMAFLRWAPPEGSPSPGKRLLTLVTMKPDGSDIRLAVTPEQYGRGGHHPMWTPDGEHITLNLNIRDGTKDLDLVQVRYDGADLHSIHGIGSGHPSMHRKYPFVISDAYPREPVTRGDGTAPLRLIDLRSRTEVALAQVNLTRSETPKLSGEFRTDAHPVWDPSGRFVVFNGIENDTRCVYLADVGPWLEGAMKRT